MIRKLKLSLIISVSFALFVASVADARHRSRRRTVDVMTQNLYIGVDVFRLVGVPFEEIPFRASEVLGIIHASNPPERMTAIAREIARRKPHLIGLQEVYRIQMQTPGDFLLGNPVPAEDDLYDYLTLLTEALEARGTPYTVAAVVENVDVELPAVGLDENENPVLIDVRVRDRDVILVRDDVEFANSTGFNFAAHTVLPIGPGLVALRGYASVDAWVGGRKYHFVNTHLEVEEEDPAISTQTMQADELIAALGSVDDPLIVVGDFNSHAEREGETPYRRFVDAGFVDAWTAQRGRVRAGNTCCHDELLRDPTSELDERIDLVWVRGGEHTVAAIARTFGDRPRQRTPSGLWPSDHAGVRARIRLSR